MRGAGRAWHKAKSLAPQRSLWYSAGRAIAAVCVRTQDQLLEFRTLVTGVAVVSGR